MDQSETQTEIAHASSTIGLSFKNTKIELVQNDQEKDQMSRISSRNRSFWSLADNFKAQLKVSPSQIRNNGSDGFNWAHFQVYLWSLTCISSFFSFGCSEINGNRTFMVKH